MAAMRGGVGGYATGGRIEGLLEREHALEALSGAMDAARGGSGRVVVLEGSPGVGKSCLIERAGQLAQGHELAVLRWRCGELEEAVPWALARSVLAPAIDALESGEREAIVDAAGPEASTLFASAHREVRAAAPLARQMRRAHALTWLVSDLAARAPLAMLLDDVHWADTPSLGFLAYLCGRVQALPLALVVTTRPRQTGTRADLLDRIASGGDAVTVAVEPLSEAATGELVHEVLEGDADEGLLSACWEVSGGNPFYLKELLRELIDDARAGVRPAASSVRTAAPSAVVRSVRLRLSALGEDALALARAVAILGDGAARSQAATQAGLELEAASRALEGLIASELLRDREALGFVHPLVASAVVEDLGIVRGGQLHLQAARLLCREGLELPRVAAHLLSAARNGDAWVVQTLRQAARNALAEGAPELAAECLARALEEPAPAAQRGELLAELGRVEVSLGRPGAVGHLRAAIDATDQADRRAELMLEHGRALLVAGDPAAAVEAFDRGAAELEDDDHELARELRAARWMSATLDQERWGAISEEASDFAQWTDPLSRGQRQLLAQLAQQRALEGAEHAEVAVLARRAWGDGELLRAEGCDGMAWPLVTGALLVIDELELEISICEAVIADARERGSPMAYATASYCRAFPLVHQGRIDEALADATVAIEARADGWATFVASAVSTLASALLAQGSTAEAREVLEPAVGDPGVRRSLEYALVLSAHGRLLLAEGRPEAALPELLALGELVGRLGIDRPSIFPWRCDAATAAALAGAPARARELASEAVSVARFRAVPRVIARALRARAVSERGEEAIATLREAYETLDGEPSRLEHAHVAVELGAALRRAHRRAEARPLLEEGLSRAHAAGALGLASSARTELAAAGARVSGIAAASQTAQLTPSERRVARLAADGHSNREIAQMLFVTVKAVEYHLGNAYSKLDIRRRGQLSRALEANEPR